MFFERLVARRVVCLWSMYVQCFLVADKEYKLVAESEDDKTLVGLARIPKADSRFFPLPKDANIPDVTKISKNLSINTSIETLEKIRAIWRPIQQLESRKFCDFVRRMRLMTKWKNLCLNLTQIVSINARHISWINRCRTAQRKRRSKRSYENSQLCRQKFIYLSISGASYIDTCICYSKDSVVEWFNRSLSGLLMVLT